MLNKIKTVEQIRGKAKAIGFYGSIVRYMDHGSIVIKILQNY